MILSKFKYLATAMLLFLSPTIEAEHAFDRADDIEALTQRRLIVMIEEPRDEILKKIAKNPKRGSVEDYQNDLKEYNANMKAVVEKFWPYNKTDIQYKTFDEIMALCKSKSKDYAVLACMSAQGTDKPGVSGYTYFGGLHWTKDIKRDTHGDGNYLMSTLLFVDKIEDWGGIILPVYQMPMFDLFPTKTSIVQGIKGAEEYFTFKINTKKLGSKNSDEKDRIKQPMKAKSPQLAQRTLLIREDWLEKNLTPEKLAEIYPYKYKICDRAFMDNVVMTQDPNYAYGVGVPVVNTAKEFFQCTIDPVDHQRMTAVAEDWTGGGFSTAKPLFTIKTIKQMVEQIQGKK